jgi:CRP-like cAMP-binding protein
MLSPDQLSQDVLIDSFKKIFPLSSQEREALISRFLERRIKRRGFILQQGDICKHFTFIVSGCFKMYAIDQAGKEHNMQFAAEGEWIADLASFYSEKPSGVHIEAMEPAVILQIKHDDLLDLYIGYHRFDRHFRIIVETKYIELQNRVLQNISVTAEQRYLNFLDQFPELANRLPNTQIASYLGITPEFLSKIRKVLVHRP